MRIALDVSSAARAESTGVAMYIRRMVAAFARLKESGEPHRFTLVTRASRLKNVFRQSPVPAPNFKNKLMLEGLHPVFSRATDIFHGLDARLPGKWMRAATVVTIHDVFSALQSTEFATEEFRAMKRNRYQELIARADRIVCVSESVRRDVLSALQPDPAKLRVVHEAGGEGFFPRSPEEVQAVRARHGLDRPYYIFVGSVNKRKNVPVLAEAFAAAKQKTGSDAILALAGRIGYGGGEIRAALEKSAAGGALKLLGYVPDADIPGLYSGAQALLFSTLYEGFGIPVVEAFACGCPVIGANVGSLPEIIGDAGLLPDPRDVDSIAAAVVRFMEDEIFRKKCAQLGLERAKQFSWDKAAQECLQIYRELL